MYYVKRSKVQSFFKELASCSYDIKAETMVSLAVENGCTPDDFIIFLNVFFEREYTKDIAGSELINDEWKRQFVELHLSRPGFYDILPEGLFFQPTQKDYSKGAKNAAEMALQYRKDKTTEKATRKFFQPFEHEFFYQQVLKEKEEISLLKQFKKPVPDIWDFPEVFNQYIIDSFLLLLPYTHQIAGNLSLMETAIKLISGEKITIIKKIATETKVIDETMALGEFNLGVNMICGDLFWEDSLTLEYKIGPLKKYKLADFLENGIGKILIDHCNKFFAPVEADVIITIEIDKLHHDILLETEDLPILGYSTIL